MEDHVYICCISGKPWEQRHKNYDHIVIKIMDIQKTCFSDNNAVKNEKMWNKTFLESIIKYYMRVLGTRKWMKVYILSEMKICCWHKRKLETLWEVCFSFIIVLKLFKSFIIVLKRSQTLREMGLSCVHPNWIGWHLSSCFHCFCKI